MSEGILVYILRRDLRVADNPIFHEIAKQANQSQRPFSHLLPIYVFPANQVEVGGFVADSSKTSPYPEARSQVAGFWRCGPLRAKFLAESVWDTKKELRDLGSDLVLRAGTVKDVVKNVLQSLQQNDLTVSALWMTGEEGEEEQREERAVSKLCSQFGVKYNQWKDEKYFIDE